MIRGEGLRHLDHTTTGFVLSVLGGAVVWGSKTHLAGVPLEACWGRRSRMQIGAEWAAGQGEPAPPSPAAAFVE